MSRDHSIQEWIDLTYNPYDGSGISKQITDLLAQLGRTPPPSGVQCPTKTNRIPQFSHKLHVSETQPIPRDQAVAALTLMAREQDPSRRLLFAALEVAMQLNCWTVPEDIRAVVQAKGWMQSVAASQAFQASQGAGSQGGPQGGSSPQSSNPAPRSLNDDADDDFDLFNRNIFDDEDTTDPEIYARDGAADADDMFDLWIREADAEAEAEAEAEAYIRPIRFLERRPTLHA